MRMPYYTTDVTVVAYLYTHLLYTYALSIDKADMNYWLFDRY